MVQTKRSSAKKIVEFKCTLNASKSVVRTERK